MIEIQELAPRVVVEPAEYIRLLGYPRGWTLDGRARELSDWARQWYARYGRPWTFASGVDGVRIDAGTVVIDGTAFTSDSELKAHLQELLRYENRKTLAKYLDEYNWFEAVGREQLTHRARV